MLMGEFNHSIDDKNRLIIPSKLRNELGNEAVITRGLDKCLFICFSAFNSSIVSDASSESFGYFCNSVRLLSSVSRLLLIIVFVININLTSMPYISANRESIHHDREQL